MMRRKGFFRLTTCYCKLDLRLLEVQPNWYSAEDLWYHMFYNVCSSVHWFVIDARSIHFQHTHRHLSANKTNKTKLTVKGNSNQRDNNVAQDHRRVEDWTQLVFDYFLRLDAKVDHDHDLYLLMQHLREDQMLFYYQVSGRVFVDNLVLFLMINDQVLNIEYESKRNYKYTYV